MLRELPDAAWRKVLVNAAQIGPLQSKYSSLLDDLDTLELTGVPVLTKDELRVAFHDLLRRSRASVEGAFVYGSGGTTSAPKLSLIPTGMFVSDILAQWRPLAPDDVLVNFNSPGRLWSSHNFFNMLAHESGAVVIPLGSVEHEQMAEWLDFVEGLGANALDATPSHIAHILQFCESAQRRPPAFHKLLWTGEAYSGHAAELTRRLLPDAELYGVYGSTETWVIGCNGPSCPTDTFHVLPYQHVEIEDGVVLVTNTHPGCINPVLRYRIGDRGEVMPCPCGRAEPALRIVGRDDPQLKFVSVLVTPQEIAEEARAEPGVRDVQLALFGLGSADERMEVRVLLEPDTDRDEAERRVRERVLTRVYRLGWAVATAPSSFAVRAVDRLEVNQRTHKTPLLVHKPHA